MSHPDPHGQPGRTPIRVGEVWENPVTRERATILERPWDNPSGRATAELTVLVGARVVGEHFHPALVEQFTVLEGELTGEARRADQHSLSGRDGRRPRRLKLPSPRVLFGNYG